MIPITPLALITIGLAVMLGLFKPNHSWWAFLATADLVGALVIGWMTSFLQRRLPVKAWRETLPIFFAVVATLVAIVGGFRVTADVYKFWWGCVGAFLSFILFAGAYLLVLVEADHKNTQPN